MKNKFKFMIFILLFLGFSTKITKADLYVIDGNGGLMYLSDPSSTVYIDEYGYVDYPNYEIDENFNIKNEINYDTYKSNIYSRNVLKKIMNGDYTKTQKDKYYQNSIKYFYYINNEKIIDSRDNKPLSHNNVSPPSSIIDDRAGLFTTEGLIELYFNYPDISIISYEDEDERQMIFSKFEKMDMSWSLNKILFYNKSTKYLYGTYNGDIIYKKKITDDSKFIKEFNKCIKSIYKEEKYYWALPKPVRTFGFYIVIIIILFFSINGIRKIIKY